MSELIKPLEILISSGIRIDSGVARTEKTSPIIKVGQEDGVWHIGPKSPGKRLFVTFNREEERDWHISGFTLSQSPAQFYLTDGTNHYQYKIHHNSSTLPNLGRWAEVSLADYHKRLNELVQP